MTVRVEITQRAETKKELTDDMLEAVSKSIGGIWNELVDSTPVKTGNARASWQVVREGGSGSFLPYGPKYPRPSLSMPSISSTTDGVEIINTAAHLEELNYGNLTRPPLLFVEAAIERGVKRTI